jgi:hypothetical protein
LSKPRKITTDVLLLAIVTGCLLLAILREFSYYIPLDIPAPLSYLPNGQWDTTEYIRKDFVDEYGRVFILRKEGRAYGSKDGYSFDNPEHTLKYFSDYLLNEKWAPANISEDYKCEYGLPEKEFVPGIKYEEYLKIGDDPDRASRKICVAIIKEQQLYWENYDGFKVILISIQYSPLTSIYESFRHW